MELPIRYDRATWQQRKAAREECAFRQDYRCHYCKGDLGVRPKQDKRIDWRAFPSNFTKYPVHLHHSHDTGMTIGAVHAYCNAVLWQYHGE